LMNKVVAYVRLMRPVNCTMMGFAVIVGGLLTQLDAAASTWTSLAFGFTTGFMLTAASMIINDYYDREIDAVNEPARPIPSGLVKPKEALGFSVVPTVCGFAAAYLTNVYCLVAAVIAWTVFFAYTTVGKRSGLPGNLLVSACVATPFVYGSLAVAGRIEMNVLLFASMAFLSNTGREVTKGISDVEGDRTKNVKTLAVVYGERKAALSASAFYLSAVALSPLPWLMNLVSVWFIPFVAITDVGLAASSLMLLKDY